MSKERFKHFVYRQIIPRAGLTAVRILNATCRVRLMNPGNEQAALNESSGLVYASWHQRFFPGITFFSTRKPIAIIVSKSLDGEMIARVVRALGWHPVRGTRFCAKGSGCPGI